MNWNEYVVQERDLQELINYNQPIPATGERPLPNAGVVLRVLTGKTHNAVYDAQLDAYRKINSSNPQFRDMANRDLALYNDHLLNESVNTIVVDGLFGTGKTSIVSSHLVEGLKKEQATHNGIQKAYISKPHVIVGDGYGFLPGDLNAKMAEEFKSYTQYFTRYGGPGYAEFLMMIDIEESGRLTKERAKALEEPMLEMLPFEYLRGRDVDTGWIVLDEAQNTGIKEMSTFLSRPGDDAKMIVAGDTTFTQIDKRGNTPENNGLAFAKEIYKGKKYAAYVEMRTVNHILRGQRVRDLYQALVAMKNK